MVRLTRRIRWLAATAAWIAAAAAILCFLLPGATSWAESTAREALARASEARSALSEEGTLGSRIQRAGVLHAAASPRISLAQAPPRARSFPKP